MRQYVLLCRKIPNESPKWITLPKSMAKLNVRITFCNEENGFTIAKVKVKGEKDLVTVAGPLPGVNQKRLAIQLTEKQMEGVKTAVTKKVMVLTGGPGTGKTTIIKAILEIFRRLTHRIIMGAPTGRAAKRMSETTGWEAKTLHRILEWSPKEMGFKKDQEHPLDADVVIVDEASMIDNLLMHHLLKAVPKSAVLILVGDVNQLPSVGAGNVLKDIINSGVVPVVELQGIFRQAMGSLIITNAHRIHRGEFPRIAGKGELQDFYFIQ